MSSATVYSLIEPRYLIHTPWAKFWSHYNNCLRETHDSRLKSSKAPFNGEHMDWREYRGTSPTSFPGFSPTRPYGARVGERTWERGYTSLQGWVRSTGSPPHPTVLSTHQSHKNIICALHQSFIQVTSQLINWSRNSDVQVICYPDSVSPLKSHNGS